MTSFDPLEVLRSLQMDIVDAPDPEVVEVIGRLRSTDDESQILFSPGMMAPIQFRVATKLLSQIIPIRLDPFSGDEVVLIRFKEAITEEGKLLLSIIDQVPFELFDELKIDDSFIANSVPEESYSADSAPALPAWSPSGFRFPPIPWPDPRKAWRKKARKLALVTAKRIDASSGRDDYCPKDEIKVGILAVAATMTAGTITPESKYMGLFLIGLASTFPQEYCRDR